MDQKEHVATLAALGTVGLAVTGLALGTNEGSVYSTRPGKRKWPGSTVTTANFTPQTPIQSRRAVSQPTSSLSTQERTPYSSHTSLFRSKASRDVLETTPLEGHENKLTESRGTSKSRRSVLRPWTSDTKESSEQRDVSSGSSWLKRMSSLSSTHGSSPASSILHEGRRTLTSSPSTLLRPGSTDATMPNKLVKRATSQRALSYEHAKGILLRRPATSHQRSQTFGDPTLGSAPMEVEVSQDSTRVNGRPETATTTQIWRPFFESASPRKRRQSDVFADNQQIKTVATSYLRCPNLVLGTAIERPSLPDDIDGRVDLSPPLLQRSAPSGRHKLRRSMNSIRRSARRRNFTDPTVQVSHTDANGTISPIIKNSPLSPISHTSTFDIELPRGTPIFNSSPPVSSGEDGFVFRKRSSITPSEPHTTSSDNETRIFTDDDSMDFRSDTAYDSIATRATSASHSGLRISKLETIFAERTSDEVDEKGLNLEALMQKASIDDHDMPDVDENGYDSAIVTFRQASAQISEDGIRPATPVRSLSTDVEDMSATPVPPKPSNANQFSSPPLLPSQPNGKTFEKVGDMIDDMDIDSNEDIDWSPKFDSSTDEQVGIGSVVRFPFTDEPSSKRIQLELPLQDSKRSSIFDWSEQQHSGSSPRPKTVHGNQGNENRSRSSGRKEMHLRSQSVPVNREAQVEDTPQSASKYSTWGLGHKPVSEEWSDDFEFDDLEDPKPILIRNGDTHDTSHDSIRSVKVPQAIIDRQASVHLQFGQVQEFMLLVEELKRLRARATALHLLDSHSKQLWEDAESIINLATINEEDQTLIVPASPTSSDIFADETTQTSHLAKDHPPVNETKRHSGTRRSVSSASTTPFTGRARGESLAQAKSFLQTIHQNRTGIESSSLELEIHQQKKLPFDTQDLRDLVVRSGVITRALKEIVRKAEGVTVSPHKTPPKPKDPPFSNIFNVPEDGEGSPCPPFRKPGLPKSRSANSYLETSTENKQTEGFSTRLTLAAMV